LQWLPSDTEELFIKNKEKRLEELKTGGWLNTEIEYSFNNYGFRSEEFDTTPSILYLGCSFTVGIGLRIEHTWPYLVSTAMNLKCFNYEDCLISAYRVHCHAYTRGATVH
jgi:hypothetical protein